MQVRGILADISTDRLRLAGEFAALVVVAVVARSARLWVLAFNWLARIIPFLRGDYEPATTAQSILVGWCGMRGLVTLATSLALPADFPQRDLAVLTAFAVILRTLVFQGMTLVPFRSFGSSSSIVMTALPRSCPGLGSCSPMRLWQRWSN